MVMVMVDKGLVEAARKSLSNTVGYAWMNALLTVVADPDRTRW
jgi:hypothetical protein